MQSGLHTFDEIGQGIKGFDLRQRAEDIQHAPDTVYPIFDEKRCHTWFVCEELGDSGVACYLFGHVGTPNMFRV